MLFWESLVINRPSSRLAAVRVTFAATEATCPSGHSVYHLELGQSRTPEGKPEHIFAIKMISFTNTAPGVCDLVL